MGDVECLGGAGGVGFGGVLWDPKAAILAAVQGRRPSRR